MIVSMSNLVGLCQELPLSVTLSTHKFLFGGQILLLSRCSNFVPLGLFCSSNRSRLPRQFRM